MSYFIIFSFLSKNGEKPHYESLITDVYKFLQFNILYEFTKKGRRSIFMLTSIQDKVKKNRLRLSSHVYGRFKDKVIRRVSSLDFRGYKYFNVRERSKTT